MIAILTDVETETFQMQLSYKITPAFTSLIVTSIIIIVVFVLYYTKIRNIKKNIYPRSFAFVFQLYVEFIHSLLLQILGPKFEKLTPYFIYLFTYILFCNVISVFGFDSPTSSLTITLSLSLITWLGIFVMGFKYQKIAFLKKYTFNIKLKGKVIPVMINPLNVVSQFAPLISLSFRL
jgi:F-type H+-transporting ATPase subunit a